MPNVEDTTFDQDLQSLPVGELGPAAQDALSCHGLGRGCEGLPQLLVRKAELAEQSERFGLILQGGKLGFQEGSTTWPTYPVAAPDLIAPGTLGHPHYLGPRERRITIALVQHGCHVLQFAQRPACRRASQMS